MKTLLQKAREVPIRQYRKVSTEEMELALAWARGQISYTQAKKALTGNETGHGNVYNFLAIALREYVNRQPQ